MSQLLRHVRKYHRSLALILALPLMLTLITGVLESLLAQWSIDIGLKHSLLMKIHTGEIFRLGKVYSVLNGLGLLGLVVTGLSMTRLFKPHRSVT